LVFSSTFMLNNDDNGSTRRSVSCGNPSPHRHVGARRKYKQLPFRNRPRSRCPERDEHIGGAAVECPGAVVTTNHRAAPSGSEHSIGNRTAACIVRATFASSAARAVTASIHPGNGDEVHGVGPGRFAKPTRCNCGHTTRPFAYEYGTCHNERAGRTADEFIRSSVERLGQEHPTAQRRQLSLVTCFLSRSFL
jgi:hypothetical protein